MSDFLVLANYYYNMGFNVSHISPLSENLDYRDVTDLKAPSHEWLQLIKRRQSLEELRLYPWDSAIGLGVILGYNNIRALDIDGCTNISMIREMLSFMGLSTDYEWVVKSGSHSGFHIIFRSEDHRYLTRENKVKAFRPSNLYVDNFKHLELRYKGHLVLPPSIHFTYQRYEFLNKKYPVNEPAYIALSKIESLINEFCQVFDPNVDNKALEEIVTGTSFSLELEEPGDCWAYIVIDCETTGLPLDWNSPSEDLDNWPRLVQLAWKIIDEAGRVYQQDNCIIYPNGFSIPKSASTIHGITQEHALQYGRDLKDTLRHLGEWLTVTNAIIAHNITFDLNVLSAEFIRCGFKVSFDHKRKICTMNETIDFCQLKLNGRSKKPKLEELYFKLFGEKLPDAHNAKSDVDATAKCFVKLNSLGIL